MRIRIKSLDVCVKANYNILRVCVKAEIKKEENYEIF